MVLTVSFALSPVIGLCCHRRRQNCFRRLDAGVEASGPHDFAVRVGALVRSAARVHRIPPRVRDDRETPLRGTGCESIYCCFYPAVKRNFGKSEIGPHRRPRERGDPSVSASALIAAPRPCGFGTMADGFPSTNDGGYGSLRSQGRRGIVTAPMTRRPRSRSAFSDRAAPGPRRWCARGRAVGRKLPHTAHSWRRRRRSASKAR
jgi:hypothetical protein